MKGSCLFSRSVLIFIATFFVSRMPAEAENPEVKEIDDEITPVTPETEGEFVDVDENHSEIETFTQDEMDMHISDCEGQFM